MTEEKLIQLFPDVSTFDKEKVKDIIELAKILFYKDEEPEIQALTKAYQMTKAVDYAIQRHKFNLEHNHYMYYKPMPRDLIKEDGKPYTILEWENHCRDMAYKTTENRAYTIYLKNTCPTQEKQVKS